MDALKNHGRHAGSTGGHMSTAEQRIEELEARLKDAEAEANNAMVQSLENEKELVTLKLEMESLRKMIAVL